MGVAELTPLALPDAPALAQERTKGQTARGPGLGQAATEMPRGLGEQWPWIPRPQRQVRGGEEEEALSRAPRVWGKPRARGCAVSDECGQHSEPWWDVVEVAEGRGHARSPRPGLSDMSWSPRSRV